MVKREIYDGFNDWDDVMRQFGGVYDWEKKPAPKLERKPRYVNAFYNQDGYEGSACVVYAYNKMGPYYVVEGGHCSCHGLEGQWNPEEVSIEYINRVFHENRYSNAGVYVTMREWVHALRRTRVMDMAA